MKNANMSLAVFTLASCLASTICLCLLCYTYFTGELAFDIPPMVPRKPEAQNPAKMKEKKADTEAINKYREEEKNAKGIFKDLETERNIWAVKNSKLIEREKKLTEIEKNIKRLLEAVRSENDRIQTKLEKIAQQEVKNLKQQALAMSEMEPKVASKVIMQMELDASRNSSIGRMAPRVLYYMEPKKSAAILEAMVKEGGDTPENDHVKRVNEIMDELRRLNPEIPRSE